MLRSLMAHAGNARIGQRLAVITAIAVLGLVAFAILNGEMRHRQLLTQHYAQARAAVEAATAISVDYAAREKTGALSREDAQRLALEAIQSLRFAGEYVWVNDKNHKMVMHPIKRELNGQDMSDFRDPAGTYMFREFVKMATGPEQAGFVPYKWPKPGADEPVDKISYVVQLPQWGWVFGSGVYLDDVAEEYRHELMVELLVVLVLGALVAVASSLVGRTLSRPLQAMTDIMGRLSRGDLAVDIPQSGAANELGAMASAIGVFRDNAVKQRELEAEKAKEEGARLRRQEAMEKLTASFKGAVAGRLKTVAAAATQLEATSGSLQNQAEETGRRSERVAEDAEMARDNAQTVAAATEELSASSAEIGRQVQVTGGITTEAVDKAHQARSTVAELAQVVEQVQGVVGLINEIAGQTNLLALNATIEAARAGEAGKGFAVVASEVKNLASQTARATEDIADQARAVQMAADDAAAMIGDIADIIERIGQNSGAIASAVTQQGAATSEISRNVQEAARRTVDVSDHINIVREGTQFTMDASGELHGAASSLSDQAELLREEVEAFLRDIEHAGERRAAVRYLADYPVTLSADLPGRGLVRAEGRVTDLSERGAAIASALAVGPDDDVSIDGLPTGAIRSRVAVAGHGVVRVEFVLTPAQWQQVAPEPLQAA